MVAVINNMAIENMIREMRDQIRELSKLTTVVDAQVQTSSDLRDATIRLTHALEEHTEQMRTCMRDLTAAIDRMNR